MLGPYMLGPIYAGSYIGCIIPSNQDEIKQKFRIFYENILWKIII